MSNETINKPSIGRPKGAVDTVKRKKRDDGMRTQPGDNREITSFGMKIANLPKINHDDIKAVEERVREYFNLCSEYDMKPGVAGACLALGISRSTWGNWGRNEKRTVEYTELITRVRSLLEALHEEYMLAGKINPVTGIFLAKNNFGYSDKTEFVLTPNNPMGEVQDGEALKKKYLENTYGVIDGEDTLKLIPDDTENND